MADSLVISLSADPDQLTTLSEATEEFGQSQDWSMSLMFKVQLVLEEATLNAVTHGARSGQGITEVRLSSDDEAVHIEIIDDGIPFDPLTEAPVPDIDGPVEDRRVGGLGVHLMREMMSDLSYERVGDRNCLRMMISRDE